MRYVCQLPKEEQDSLIEKVRQRLIEEGYSEIEIYGVLKDARDSKVSDIDN